MNRSKVPLISTVIAALALLNAGPVWSDPAAEASPEAKPKKAVVKKAKHKPVANTDATISVAIDCAVAAEACNLVPALASNPMPPAATVAVTASPPVMAASAPAVTTRTEPAAPPAKATAVTTIATVKVPVQASPNPPAAQGYAPPANPYLVNTYQGGVASTPDLTGPFKGIGQTFSGLGSLLPSLPGKDESLLPSIKKVYPTGEKPLVVVTFKCPTEMIGINSPVTKLLHGTINYGMDAINYTNLLSFNLQQVCQ